MKQTFPRNLDSLNYVLNFIDAFIAHFSMDESIAYAIKVSVEELFVNAVKHGTENTGDLLLELSKKEDVLKIRFLDYGAKPFNIIEAKPYNVQQPLHERKPGGVGIHLIKKYMDEIEYKYKDTTSIITLIKYLEKKHVGSKNNRK